MFSKIGSLIRGFNRMKKIKIVEFFKFLNFEKWYHVSKSYEVLIKKKFSNTVIGTQNFFFKKK